MDYKKILVAIKNIKEDARVLIAAMNSAKKHDSSLMVLHINNKKVKNKEKYKDSYITPEMLNNFIELYNPNNMDMKSEIIEGDNVMDLIVEKSKSYNLLVLGHRHMDRIEEILFDSIDERIINNITCHCLVINKK